MKILITIALPLLAGTSAGLIALAVFALLAPVLVSPCPPPTKHYAPAFQERFGDWDVDGRVQSKACRPKWPSWEVVCLA